MKAKCPFCGDAINVETNEVEIGINDEENHMYLEWLECPSCSNYIVFMKEYMEEWIEGPDTVHHLKHLVSERRIEPIATARLIPDITPPEVAKDYRAACNVLSISPEASAALSRRCLQIIFGNHLGIVKGNLATEIDEALNSGKVVGPAAAALHMVREIGNFGAHPRKSQSTGEIIDVEPGEAEANLDAIEMLIDSCFVQPQRIAEMKAGVNKKLKAAGKKELK